MMALVISASNVKLSLLKLLIVPIIVLNLIVVYYYTASYSQYGLLIRNRRCYTIPPGLRGPVKVKYNVTDEKLQFDFMRWGGISRPSGCTAREKLAVIIPYANRKQHLLTLLYNLLPYLHRQQRDFRVFVVEPVGNKEFNRAKLMNIGTVESQKFGEWSCFILHDVDLIPLDDRNIYNCQVQPRHLIGTLDTFQKALQKGLPYDKLFGGASAIRSDHFHQMNGMSNDYWGWGGEDDDAYKRVTFINKSIKRRPVLFSAYTMIEHGRDHSNPTNEKVSAELSSTNRESLENGWTQQLEL